MHTKHDRHCASCAEIVALVLTLLGSLTTHAAEPLRLARFSADVTIPIGHRCMGVLPMKAREIVDSLEARGFVLLGSNEPIVVCVVDWCEIRNDAYDRWRAVLAEAAGTVPGRVLVSSVHQHDAPVVDLGAEKLLHAVGLGGELCDTTFHERTVQRVAAAIRARLKSSAPVTHVGRGKARVAQLASNRRVESPDGEISFDRGSSSGGTKHLRDAPDGLIDPWIRTLSFWNGETPLVALHAYATHPMSYYGRGGVSADFVGMARRRLQAKTPGVLQIYASGASGDVTVGKYNDGSPENRPRLAERLYEGMSASWKDTIREPIDSITFRSVKLNLPFHDAADFTTDALRKTLENSAARTTDRILAAMGLASRQRIENGHAIDLPCIDFGSAQLLLLPGETFVGYQLLAQRMRPDAFVVSMGYGECWPGYIPTRTAFEEGFGKSWRWVSSKAPAQLEAALENILETPPGTAARLASIALQDRPADRKLDVKAALGREIISRDHSLGEVQQFIEARVQRMPEAPDSRDDWERYSGELRERVLDRVVLRGEARRWQRAERKVEWLETIPGGPGYKIRKLRFEAVPGLWIPALLYVPENLSGRVPVILMVNGHDGKGKAAHYKQLRCIEVARRGAIAMNVEWLGMGQLRGDGFSHYKMNQIDLCGTSGLAPFYLSMERSLDILLSLEHADPKRVAVAGLSGGGWQTIFISALDTRVTLTNPVAGYNSYLERARHFSDLGDSEQTPTDLAATADYAHLTALLAPRAALLTFNAKDNCCFKSAHSLPRLLEAAEPIYKLYSEPGRLRTHVNHVPGDHNFGKENRETLYAMLVEHFKLGSESTEAATEAELKDAETLHVTLPEKNADFNSLARALAANLPLDAEIPGDTGQTKLHTWQTQRRNILRGIVHAKSYSVRGTRVASEIFSGGEIVTWWKLQLGNDWTVPAVEISRGIPQETVIVVHDAGRAALDAAVEAHLRAGRRVFAVDPFYLGESRISQRPFLFALLVSSCKERPLGLQSSQLGAIAGWSRGVHGQPVRLDAHGPRTSLAALVATALEPGAIQSLTIENSYGSLREIIETNLGVNQAPEPFCFGLLERFDILQIAALVAPRQLQFAKSSERVKREIGMLEGWYRQSGGTITIE